MFTILFLAACENGPTTEIPTDTGSNGSFSSQYAQWENDDNNGGGTDTDTTDTDDGTDTDTDTDGSTTTWYYDGDGDGWGLTSTGIEMSSSPGDSWVELGGDCNDASDDIYPGATETVGNGVDENCDGSDSASTSTWYYDGDGDGYGTTISVTAAADPGTLWVSTNGDCNDSSASVHPGATETDNGVDDNCNGSVDEGFEDDDEDCTDHTYVVRFEAPSGSTSLWIGGEIYDSAGATVMPWQLWSTGTPTGMTVSTSGTTITATYTACVVSTDEWYITAGYTLNGASRWSCEGSGTLTGTFTVSRDGTALSTGSCITNGAGGSEYNF